jgi:hypothetical protein
LIDVLVVEDDLGAPGGRIVEIMLPASADDGAPVVPTEFGLLGGVRDRGVGKAVRKEINGRTARSCGECRAAAVLERIRLELTER